MFHSPQRIMGATATLETQTRSATDATTLCQPNTKTKYFKTLKRRPLAVAAS